MNKRDAANEKMLIGSIYKEIVRFTSRESIETIRIQELKAIIDNSLLRACDVHLNKIDLEEVVRIIKEELKG